MEDSIQAWHPAQAFFGAQHQLKYPYTAKFSCLFLDIHNFRSMISKKLRDMRWAIIVHVSSQNPAIYYFFSCIVFIKAYHLQ